MEFSSSDMVNFSPLIKSFTFNAYLVAGFTPISHGSKLDYYINRPSGMKGYIINLTLRGMGRVRAGEHDMYCQERDVLLFPPGVAHHYGRAEQSEFWDHLWIYFIPRPYWVDWLRWDHTDGEIGCMHLDSQQALEPLKSLFLEVIHYNATNTPLNEARAMNALERIILSCFQAQPISNHNAVDPRINALCQYINDHLGEDIKIAQLAKLIFLSPSRVAHLFKREMNQTIFSWREQQRISRARNLLQSTTLPITHIAQAVGYTDALYFSRLFHQHYGVSPREYKKRYERMNTL
jgi:AraC family transcriptional regulator of arabinose operon